MHGSIPALGVLLLTLPVRAQEAGEPWRAVPPTDVRIEAGFWGPRLETNRRVTVGYDFQKCEETGRIANFARAGGLEEGGFRGTPFDDSDVFKVVEGAARTLALTGDEKLEQYLERLIAKIAAAQEPDGYLYTARTLGLANDFTGPERWSNLGTSHELYNVGHLYEAAAAHWEATGQRALLDVALENAELIARVFGPGQDQLAAVPGHQEIELGLLALHRATGEERWLDLARFFVDQRGRADGRALYGSYSQDHAPVVEQAEAVGHAVRAGYLYAAVAELAAVTGDPGYRAAADRLWTDVVHRKMHLTGGVGARRSGEAFGEAYELPNGTAYLETCAAIAVALFHQRMFLLHGDAQYADVLERVLYNGFLSGVALSGDRFFYPNPLAWDGHTPFNQGSTGRAPWFSCSCCPVNVVRFLPRLGSWVYAVRADELTVNLYVQSTALVALPGGPVAVRQRTRYPWSGRIDIAVEPERPSAFALRLRIPGWCRGEPAPGGLYRYLDPDPAPWSIAVNGEPVEVELECGYAVLRRTWRPGDRLALELPMPVRRTVARDEVTADRGRVALERGPLVYCVEATDNGGHGGRVGGLVLADDAEIVAVERPDLLGGLVALAGKAQSARLTDDGELALEPMPLTAIPYHLWAHREPGEMAVWIARDAAAARPRRRPTPATAATPSASHVWRTDTVRALNDGLEPESSGDHGLPRFTWWNRRGTREWIRYDFAEPTEVSGAAVYWFDDTGVGQCRVPASWSLFWLDGETWRAVADGIEPGVALDRFNEVSFEPVTTSALRIDVQLQPEVSGGVLEWTVR